MSFYMFVSVLLTITFVLGLVVGSFLNVCISRVPEGGSVVRPSSHCPKCKSAIRWFHNIPLLSYLFLGGRCAYCSERISLRYPAIELLTALLFAATTWFFGVGWVTVIYWFFISALIVVSFIDLDHQIIPNVISFPGVVLGFLSSFCIPWLSWSESLVGIVVGGGVLWGIAACYVLITHTEGMGMGDVKLLAMIGAFLGYKALLPVILISSFAGAAVGLALMGLHGKSRKLAIPFGPFLSLGAVVVLFWGERLTAWYLGLF